MIATDNERAIVFNADDFGLSPAINAGILEAHRAGLVRAASLMTTAPAFAEAVAAAKLHPELDLGLHLALTEVRPALPPASIPSLVDGDRFPSLPRFLARLAARRIRADELRRELAAQIVLGQSAGLRFSHLDGHHHVHLFRPVAAVTGELARQAGILLVRRVGDGGPHPPAKLRFLQWADRRGAPYYQRLNCVDAFRGIPFPQSTAAWEELLAGLPAGLTELMCHPGQADPAPPLPDALAGQRPRELAWLVDPALAELICARGVAVRDFSARELNLARA